MSSTSIFDELTDDISSQADGATSVFTTVETVQGVTRLKVLYNGQRLLEGASNDYTVTGATQITFTFNPEASSNLILEIIE